MLRTLPIALVVALATVPAVAAGKPANPAPATADEVAPGFNGDRTAQRIAKIISNRFGAQVLNARRTQADGRPAYRLVVMNAGGNYNGAYAVHTLIVDAATGELVSQFQNTESGYTLAAPSDRALRDDAVGTVIRRETFSAGNVR